MSRCIGVTMFTNVNFPLKIHRITIIYLAAVALIMMLFSIKMSLDRVLLMGAIMYFVGMLDFLIMYFSMHRALKNKPERSLKIMRDGMGIRFVVALLITVAAIKLNYMPWAVLFGLLLIHIVVLIDSVLVSINLKK